MTGERRSTLATDFGDHAFFEHCRERVDRRLDAALPAVGDATARVVDAMRYSTLQGGKRIRPLLVYATAYAIAGDDERVIAAADDAAAAVELIHAYSLIHDDLPAMDDDDLRRGNPTCHVQFDEATAILAGDALQARAFELLASSNAIDPEVRAPMIALLARAAGAAGMVGGQMIDLLATGQQIDLDSLQTMHKLKTGALIRASVMLGALAANSSDESVNATLARFADCIGLAFQVQDDLLDATSTTDRLGKQQGADHAGGKSTYVSLLGIDASRTQLQQLYNAALESLHPLQGSAGYLESIAYRIVHREH